MGSSSSSWNSYHSVMWNIQEPNPTMKKPMAAKMMVGWCFSRYTLMMVYSAMIMNTAFVVVFMISATYLLTT